MAKPGGHSLPELALPPLDGGPLSKRQILDHADLDRLLQRQSRALLSMFEHDSRLAAVFATQQRWLMSHIGLALYFRNATATPGNGLLAAEFIAEVVRHGVASPNTADSYLKEMTKYGYLSPLPMGPDRRRRPMAPSGSVVTALCGWLATHLESLDSIDGGARAAIFAADPTVIAQLQPRIGNDLVQARALRFPQKAFSLFTWLDNGGLVMDWLINSMEPAPLQAERVRVGEISIVEMAGRLNLSRTHLARKLREAEDLGSIGWEGRRGRSVMWVSRGFRQEYADAQTTKLAIIDQACHAVFGRTTEAPRNGQAPHPIAD
jgi:AraC-like DNA-binding protein